MKTNIVSYLFVMTVILLVSHNLYSQQYDPGDKIRDVIMLVNMSWVDDADINTLEEGAIVKMLQELDPHSVYISSEDMKEIAVEMEGNFDGIGVQFQVYKDTILVISPISGGPSERLGIMAGDKIVEIDDEDATGPGINNKFVFDHLRGERGSEVKVGIIRGKKKDILEFTIIRDKIPVSSIDAAYMVDDVIGYIKLNRFAINTMAMFYEEIKQLKSQGMKKLLLDLRSNPGGYLHAAAELADQFLPEGMVIVYTEGEKSPRQTYESTWLGGFLKGDLVIMIDEGSASSSEIVAGAVQDWDRGIIVGRRSFGKGLVQREYPLDDGSAVRITTARYYTPTGRSIQKPYENGVGDYIYELERRYEHGELLHADSIDFPDSLKYYTPSGKVVYGGGGIMPDVFVPLDSTGYSDYLFELTRNGIFNQFVIGYMDTRRKKFSREYDDENEFISKYRVETTLLEEFYSFAEKQGVERDDKGIANSEVWIKVQLKALVARNIFDISAYYHVVSETDNTYVEALRLLR